MSFTTVTSEAIIRKAGLNVNSAIVASGAAIAKGDVMELSDPMTVSAHGGNVDTPVVGIAAEEKVAGNTGKLFISVITNCVAKLKVLAGGSCTIGDTVSMGNAAGEINLASSLDDEKGWSLGWAMETGAAAEYAAIRINK